MPVLETPYQQFVQMALSRKPGLQRDFTLISPSTAIPREPFPGTSSIFSIISDSNRYAAITPGDRWFILAIPIENNGNIYNTQKPNSLYDNQNPRTRAILRPPIHTTKAVSV